MTASLTLKDEQLSSRLKELIRHTCGFTFGADREETLFKAMKKRMIARDIRSPESYYALLLQKQDELQALVELLTVNETYFFREPNHLKLVIETLIPELLARQRCGPLRILSAGCSTGEEAYSIAILLRERFGEQSEQQFSIVGLDIDSKAVTAARKGVYGRQSFRGTDPLLLERWFETDGAGAYRICEPIRRQVQFEVANLLDISYPSGITLQDIIFYRNVSIYFPQDIQLKIFTRLADLLNKGGFLIVGASETLPHDVGILSLLQQNGLFFYSKAQPLGIGDRRSIQRTICSTKTDGTGRHAPVHPEPHPRQNRTNHSRDLRQDFDSALDKARNNQDDEALELLETIIAHDSSFLKAHGLKACLLLNAARHDDARIASEIMLSLDPLCREACLMLGIIARHQGDDGEAFKRFREALYIDATCWLAHFYTAEIMFARQEGKRARSSYETVVSILENNSPTELGQAFFPLSFNVQQYLSICRHKLSLLKENR